MFNPRGTPCNIAGVQLLRFASSLSHPSCACDDLQELSLLMSMPESPRRWREQNMANPCVIVGVAEVDLCVTSEGVCTEGTVGSGISGIFDDYRS